MTDRGETSWEDGFIERVESALPIEDVVGWLLQEFPGADAQQVMAMLQRVYQRDYHIEPAAPEQRSYALGDDTWTAYPQRVAAGPAGGA